MLDSDKPLPVAAVSIRLTQRAAIWLALLLVLLIVAILQHNNLLYFLVFWLISLSLLALVVGVKNLSSIQADLIKFKPVFAGDAIDFTLELTNLANHHLFGVYSAFDTEKRLNIGKHQTIRQAFSIDSGARGRYRYRLVDLHSSYPLDLFLFSAKYPIDRSFWVYPQPLIMPSADLSGADSDANQGDLAGIRAYQPGDKLNHIDWKSLAKGQTLQTKLFAQTERHQTIEFSLASTEQSLLERQLSVLTAWIIEAYSRGLAFQLNLDGYPVYGSGEAHYHRCLEMLAVYQSGAV